jgi:hypothetical protein
MQAATRRARPTILLRLIRKPQRARPGATKSAYVTSPSSSSFSQSLTIGPLAEFMRTNVYAFPRESTMMVNSPKSSGNSPPTAQEFGSKPRSLRKVRSATRPGAWLDLRSCVNRRACGSKSTRTPPRSRNFRRFHKPRICSDQDVVSERDDRVELCRFPSRPRHRLTRSPGHSEGKTRDDSENLAATQLHGPDPPRARRHAKHLYRVAVGGFPDLA